MTAPLHRLATLLDGELDGRDIRVAGHIIRCNATGQVVIADDPTAEPLGSWRDPERCAARFRAAVGA